MHELGVLRQIVKTVDRIASENHISAVKQIVLEVGELSGFVSHYLEKLFPVAIEGHLVLQTAQLRICPASGKRLMIKEIAY